MNKRLIQRCARIVLPGAEWINIVHEVINALGEQKLRVALEEERHVVT
jgi:hypothetical protein